MLDVTVPCRAFDACYLLPALRHYTLLLFSIYAFRQQVDRSALRLVTGGWAVGLVYLVDGLDLRAEIDRTDCSLMNHCDQIAHRLHCT